MERDEGKNLIIRDVKVGGNRYIKVCVIQGKTVEDVRKWLNLRTPCPAKHGWMLVNEAGGVKFMPPVICKDIPDKSRIHYVFGCIKDADIGVGMG